MSLYRIKPRLCANTSGWSNRAATIAMTEAIWAKEPSDEVAAIIIEATGQPIQPPEVWESLFQDAGLVELVFESHAMTMRDEARNQSGLLSLGEYLRIFGRAIRTLLTDRETRSLIKYMSSNPYPVFRLYGLRRLCWEGAV